MGKVVVLGLDGATFALLDPLLRDNRLPHLARLVRRGVRGSLRSTIHPLTPAAWTSAVTGLNPGKHGVFDFRRRRAGSYALELINGRQRAGEPLWEILSQQGRRCGVFNVPLTYPPDAVNGFMVSGMDTPGLESPFVYPPALRQSLLQAVPGYAIDLDEATTDEDALLDRLQALTNGQQQALDVLLARYPDLDFLMAVFVATDRLYHTFWRYLDPAEPDYHAPRAAGVRAFHEQLLLGMDESLGRLLEWAGDDATCIVMSDHGFGALRKDVYINRFLLDAGYLRIRPGQEESAFEQMVDWPHTRAYSLGFFGNINLNVHGREPQGCVEDGREAESLKRDIMAALRTLTDPGDAQPLVSGVYRREELYSGPFTADAPDLLVVMRDYAYMTRDGSEAVLGSLLSAPMSRHSGRLAHSGNHRLDGILLMSGPTVRAGDAISGADITDIAPTVLYALGLPVPGAMDGRVLRQAFTDESLARRPPQRLVAPLPPVESKAQRQIAGLAQRVTELEAQARRMDEQRAAGAGYARQLEVAVAAKNSHIAQVEATVRSQEAELAGFQRSIFFRAYRRWQDIARRLNRRGQE